MLRKRLLTIVSVCAIFMVCIVFLQSCAQAGNPLVTEETVALNESIEGEENRFRVDFIDNELIVEAVKATVGNISFTVILWVLVAVNLQRFLISPFLGMITKRVSERFAPKNNHLYTQEAVENDNLCKAMETLAQKLDALGDLKRLEHLTGIVTAMDVLTKTDNSKDVRVSIDSIDKTIATIAEKMSNTPVKVVGESNVVKNIVKTSADKKSEIIKAYKSAKEHNSWDEQNSFKLDYGAERFGLISPEGSRIGGDYSEEAFAAGTNAKKAKMFLVKCDDRQGLIFGEFNVLERYNEAELEELGVYTFFNVVDNSEEAVFAPSVVRLSNGQVTKVEKKGLLILA